MPGGGLKKPKKKVKKNYEVNNAKPAAPTKAGKARVASQPKPSAKKPAKKRTRSA